LAAGHRVHRCYEPDGPGFPCAAIREPGSCPLDHGVDVALAVRVSIEPRPTRYELGASCAIRAKVPIAELGLADLDPFEPWVTCRTDDDVVQGVETAADRGLEDLRHSIAARIGAVVPSTVDPGEITYRFQRDGQRLVVHLYGPAIGQRVEQAMAVRVLDAVWHSSRTYGEVDVSYHATELGAVTRSNGGAPDVREHHTTQRGQSRDRPHRQRPRPRRGPRSGRRPPRRHAP